MRYASLTFFFRVALILGFNQPLSYAFKIFDFNKGLFYAKKKIKAAHRNSLFYKILSTENFTCCILLRNGEKVK